MIRTETDASILAGDDAPGWGVKQGLVQGLHRYQQYDRQQIAQCFEPNAPFTRGAGRWGIPGIIETPKQSGNFVFIVTLGKPVEGNPYQDAITEDGYLIWESQTRQNFETEAIQKMLAHDSSRKNIYLFLRGDQHSKYYYMGLLDYQSHDPNQTNPVHFVWKIQGWNLAVDKLAAMQLPVHKPFFPTYSLHLSVEGTLVRQSPPQGSQNQGLAKKAAKGKATPPVDWAEVDMRNRNLGYAGELLVLRYEQAQLQLAGRGDLAARVMHISEVDAAAGFDIASFYTDGRPKYIEVKTTQGPASTPFFISSNEVKVSAEMAQSYVIYRLHDWQPGKREITFFEINGNVADQCRLVPTSYRAFTIGK